MERDRDAAEGLRCLLEKLRCTAEDLVQYHMSPLDYGERDRVLEALEELLRLA